MKKTVFIVIDGMADLPSPKSSRTPLSSAKKPNMDWFAKNGIVGEVTVIPEKMWGDMAHASISHIASSSLLGYNPKKFDIARGPLEAVGSDIPYQSGHLALRCNFSTVDSRMRVIDRHAGRNISGLSDMTSYINEKLDVGVPFSLVRTWGHRAVLIIKSKISDKIDGNDPLVEGGIAKNVVGHGASGMASAKIVQDFVDKSHELLEYHPRNSERVSRGIPSANYIVVREAGNFVHNLAPSISEKFGFSNPFCIAEPGSVRAVCMLAGFDSIQVPESSFEDQLDFIFESLEIALEDHDLVFVHIKGPIDEGGHDGKIMERKRGIEEIDRRMGMLKDKDITLVITTDHITSTAERKHMPGPVPFLLYGMGKNSAKSFSETSAKKSRVKLRTPSDLWSRALGK